MAYKGREGTCVDCGQGTNKRHKTGVENVCFECGMKRASSAAREMAAKSGPAWDKFCASVGPQGAHAPRRQRK